MKKLIGMVEFINHITTKPLGGQQVASVRHVELEKYRMIFKHSQFLQQTPTIGMFVPCDEDGNVLEKPTTEGVDLNDMYDWNLYNEDLQQYQQAEQRVIFEGCTAEKIKDYYIIKFNDNIILVSWNESKTIEDLVPYNLILK